MSNTDRIEKSIELKAPVSRVWKALTDHREFGTWFRVKLEGPFVPGEVSRGQITYPGYEHIRWVAVVQRMEPERLFSFTWHPTPSIPTRTIRASHRRSWSSRWSRLRRGRCFASSSLVSIRSRRSAAARLFA